MTRLSPATHLFAAAADDGDRVAHLGNSEVRDAATSAAAAAAASAAAAAAAAGDRILESLMSITERNAHARHSLTQAGGRRQQLAATAASSAVPQIA